MVVTTTPGFENGEIIEYRGIVSGEIVAGINFVKDFGASVRNFIGGRSAGYEEELAKARNAAVKEMEEKAAAVGANAVVGVKIDYESFGGAGMVMVLATGTAVVVQNK